MKRFWVLVIFLSACGQEQAPAPAAPIIKEEVKAICSSTGTTPGYKIIYQPNCEELQKAILVSCPPSKWYLKADDHPDCPYLYL